MNILDSKEKIQEHIKTTSELELELVWIPKIMANQTMDEVQYEQTKEKNGFGLNGRDAPIVTSIWHQIQRGKKMTPGQVTYLRKALPKYSGQYLAMTKVN